MNDEVLTPDDGVLVPGIWPYWAIVDNTGGSVGAFGPLVLAIMLSAAFFMGAHDAQVHLLNAMQKAEAVKASLPPDWRPIQ